MCAFEKTGPIYPDLDVATLKSAGFWTQFEDFSPAAKSDVKSILMDAILSIIAGLKSLPENEIKALSEVIASEPQQYRPIFYTKIKTSLEMAGFINGYNIRYADLCDVRRQTVGRGGHPADMVAAALALCDDEKATGKNVLEAINLGYQMWAVICNEMMIKVTNLDTVTALALTVPVMTSVILGDPYEKMQNALWLSATGGPVAVEVRSSRIVTNSKSGATGYAISRAFWSHKMSNFLEGTPTMFTGVKGWSKMVAPLEENFAAYPDDEVYGQIQLKAFPCCNVNQVATEGAVNIHKSLNGNLEDISRISIQVCEKDAALALRPGSPQYPTDHPSADHHIRFCSAIGLKYGALVPMHYEEKYLKEAAIHDLIDKMEVTIMPQEQFLQLGGENGAGIIEVFMNDGSVYSEKISRPCGLYTGLEAQERVSKMRATVEAKRQMIEKSYSYDLSSVAEIVFGFEKHSGKDLINAIEKVLTQ